MCISKHDGVWFVGLESDYDGIVYTTSDYSLTRKPDGKDSNCQPTWDKEKKQLTEIGRLVYEFKYEQKNSVKQDLVNYLCEVIKRLNDRHGFDYIIPIPNKERKFTISDIAQDVSKSLNIKYKDILMYTKNLTMKNVPKEERKYIKNFMKCTGTLPEGSTILLLDDFVETGSTIKESARAIKMVNERCTIIPLAIIRDYAVLN